MVPWMMAFVRGSTGQTAFGKMIDEGDCDPGRLEKKSFCIEGVTSDAPSQCFSFHALIWRIVHAIGGTAMQLRIFGRTGIDRKSVV